MILLIGKVKLIGQQLQGRQRFPLNTRVMRAFLHKSGSIEHSNDLNKIDRRMHNSQADSLRHFV